MFQTFMHFASFANIIAACATIILMLLPVIYSFPNREMPIIDEARKCIGSCRISGIVFILCAWMIIPSERIELIADLYKQVTDKCFLVGKLWLILGFVNIIISFFLSLTRNRTKMALSIKSIRNSTFATGAAYFVLSFLLTVS